MSAIKVVPYDPAWPGSYAAERARLLRSLDLPGDAIEHIGSTAVPGLAAKPILDILVGAPSLLHIEERIEALMRLGYRHVGEYDRLLPERRYFVRGEADVRTCHLHAVVQGSDFWSERLAFRDALRSNPEIAARYAELKRRLAEALGADSAAYTDAKTGFVRDVLEAWRRG